MNEYDNDNDELDEYSSGSNSFRARSNTWPLNKPDLTAPSSNACIDETLPEIELEEDDLFTTNDNWSAGFVDHDIMSWDPILNAQNQQQQQASHQPPIIHHQAQSTTTNHVQQINSQQHQTSQAHPRHQSIHLNHHQHQQQQQQIPIHSQQQTQHVHHQPHRHHQHVSTQSVAQQHQHTHQQPQQAPLQGSHQCSEATYLDAATGIMMGAANNAPIQQAQTQPPHQQISHVQQEHQLQQQQTLNSSHCLDTDDASEYHINQLHHLHLDGSTPDQQQENYATTLASGATNNVAAMSPSQMSSMSLHTDEQSHDFGMALRSDHHQHQHQLNQHPPPHQHQQQSHLQPLTSAGYDYDTHQQHIQHHQQNDYDIKLAQDDNPSSQHQNHHHLNHLEHPSHHQQTNTHQLHQYNHHPQQQQHIQSSHLHQYHDINASSPDNGLGGSQLLSSSLSTSGIGLSTDLEDLDFKSVNPSSLLPEYDEPLQQHQIQQDQFQQSNSCEIVKSEIKSLSSTSSSGKLTDSNSASKTKLNAPRRNAWGNMSYADLISQAIESTNDKRLTLSQIYDWMVQHVPYFKDKGDSNSSAGWKNSVRHNLSLHSRFKRLQNEGTGKSSWWTINPEANIGKCARRRAASMEASKYEKKRGRAKKRAEAIRQGLVSYPSLTNSSLNGSTNTLGEQQSQAQSISHLQAHTASATTSATTRPDTSASSMKQKHNLQTTDQFANKQQQSQQQTHMPQLQIQKLENHNIDQPSEQQQQHLLQLQQADYNSRTIRLLL